ncbi:MAG: tetraacyldisaccharide 4'-kinase [Deltaproteobacteria bacterium]|nr:tetraacyldisaccharide 4'-kinase [Deltaproteobacteria bacterium]
MTTRLSQAYGAVAALRRRFYERGLFAQVHMPVPVVSIGALRWGGSGKTPVAAHVAAFLHRRGRRVAIVHSGYGGKAGGASRVRCADRGDLFGDEAVLHASWLPEAIVIRAPDKVLGARLAVSAGAEVIVLDDAFSHLRLHRDLDILLVDASPPWPLPRGPGRKAPEAASHADVRWHHGRDGVISRGTEASIVSRNMPISLISSRGIPVAPAQSITGDRVFLLAAIARPEAFVHLVESLGARVVGTRFLRDHRPLRAKDLRIAFGSSARWVLTTEKDWARQGDALGGVHVLRCAVKVEVGQDVLRDRLESLFP